MSDDTARPHVVLMTCHDIGRYIGAYGVKTVLTPHLDQLAASGVRFDNAFTVSPSCSPSRAALATGRFPHSNGVMGLAHPPFSWSLHRDEQHMAALLGNSGYETHLFGHQHVTPHVDYLGFKHLYGFDEIRGCHEPALGSNVTSRLAEFLARPPSGQPLYLEINLEEPHRPYDQGGAQPDESRGVTIPGYLPDAVDTRQEMADLQGAIRQADEAIGYILQMLEGAGLHSNLLVLFAADHGLAMPRAKCTLYDPGLEIALLMRWPEAGLRGGRVFGEMVSNVDILPTVLELLNITPPASVQGQSFASLLRGEPYTERTAIFAEKTYHTYYDPMRAIRTDRFKYILNMEVTCRVEVPGDVQRGAIFRSQPEVYTDAQHPPAELYDLDRDPLEMHNLCGDPSYRDIEASLSTRLHDWMVETNDPLLLGWVPSPQAKERRVEFATHTGDVG